MKNQPEQNQFSDYFKIMGKKGGNALKKKRDKAYFSELGKAGAKKRWAEKRLSTKRWAEKRLSTGHEPLAKVSEVT